MAHPCPRCGNPVGFINASKLADDNGVIFCKSCARSIRHEGVRRERKWERSLLLSPERIRKLSADPPISSATIEAWRDLGASRVPSFRTLLMAGRASQEDRMRVMRLVYSRAHNSLVNWWIVFLSLIVFFGIIVAFATAAVAPPYVGWALGGYLFLVFFIIMEIQIWFFVPLSDIRQGVVAWFKKAGEDEPVAFPKEDLTPRDYLSELTPREFEVAVAKIFRSYGYIAKVTPFTRDYGTDILMEDESGTKYAVQVKQYASGTSIGRPVLQRLQGAMLSANADKAILVTLSTFSEPAVAYARDHGIRLVDGDELTEMFLEKEKGKFDE